MPRITPERWQTLKCIFTLAGFAEWRSSGSHHIGSKPGAPRPIVIPAYKDVDPLIIRGLIRTAGITREQYFEFRQRCR